MSESGSERSAELLRQAKEYGLGRLAALDPDALAKAAAAAGRLRGELSRELLPADEPAHVYRAAPEA